MLEYVTECANKFNKGLYNSIFYSSMMSALIIGSLISAGVMGGSSYPAFMIVNIGLVALSGIVFLFLTKPIRDETNQ
jgi:hypothetical protein